MSKVPVNSGSTYSSESLQNQITGALIANGSIPTIQSSLLHELQASGWTTSLRNYVIALVRSGECTKYDDLMDKILEEALKGVAGERTRATNGNTSNGNRPGQELKIPDSAIKEAIKVVKKELEKVCDVETK
ncbi:hypothetical protein CAC42_6030 [Sphaceloma murrayae]|uniref:Uncharacterized protein n=1 Tax=Sphaceloma murrayae TaxID=2082308 RepID=A0A2K1QV59_9PEZI|nr:hypothetical protein CAC42_6030 [Sphaceloma murrayae]